MTEPHSLFPALAVVDLIHTRAVQFDVQDLLDEFPNEWKEWQKDGDGMADVQEFVTETLHEIGLDLMDYPWVRFEPMHDDFELDVRYRSE